MGTPSQRLIVLYDGTWNDPQDRTNVYRLVRSFQDYDGDIEQRFFYDPGVGTSKLTRLRGGMFGTGLSTNLTQGYDWLARRYTQGDEIYVFGFSRGAYTARSLVGMIRKCGLLQIVTPNLLDVAEKLYRCKQEAPEGDTCRDFRAKFSREVRIHLLGVWDTVGALGIPGTVVSERFGGTYSWHDTELSKIVDRAYQAMALDEHRAAYDVSLWTGKDGQRKPENLDVEQRWFIGAHSNVGGGYGDKDLLPDLALAWLQKKALAAGLKLAVHTPPADAHLAKPRDSFKEFAKGVYATFCGWFNGGDGRHHRGYDRDYQGKPAVGVTVDESVWQRWREDLKYRPPTLVKAGKQPPA